MRIYFEDKSYLDISKSPSRGKYFVTVGARQHREIIVNSAEVTKAQLAELLDGVGYRPSTDPKPKSVSKENPKKETKPKKKTTRKKRTAKTKTVEKTNKQSITSSKTLDGYA